jgi:hypothetical protein
MVRDSLAWVATIPAEESMGSRRVCVVAFLVCAIAAHAAQGEDFARRDGDTVVFLGDSITAGAHLWENRGDVHPPAISPENGAVH